MSNIVEKAIQLEVIKYLKSPEYQKVLNKYSNRFDTKLAKFKAKYEDKDLDYKQNDLEYSELAMQIKKLSIFRQRIEDIKGETTGAIKLRELLEEQAINIESHLYNSVTNSFGGSKDTAIFTEDDMYKFEMLHDKDFHIFIVGIMNSNDNEMLSMQDKYDIYEKPEDQL